MIVLDTETTGLDGDAEICEIAMIDGNGEVLLDTLVKPTISIPDGAIAIHGITNEMVAGAPPWAELHEQFTQLIKKQKVHIYNAQYDLRLLQQTAAAHGLQAGRCDASCVMLKFTRYSGGTKWHKLTAAARTCGVSVKEAHRALGDCRMTLGVLEYMNENPRKPSKVPTTQGAIDAIETAEITRQGYTPLHVAVMRNDVSTAKLLIADGANLDAKTNDSIGCAPLHWAANDNAVEIAKLLLVSGADVNAEDGSECTPLHTAAEKKSLEVAELLLASGADVDAKNESECTPLHTAVEEKSLEVAKLLLANSADINAKDETECTPLHMATSNNAAKVAKLLIDNGANLNATDFNGFTPLDCARSYSYARMVRLLTQAGGTQTAGNNKSSGFSIFLWGILIVALLILFF